MKHMDLQVKKSTFALVVFMTCVLALFSSSAPALSFADVREDDVILGKTVGERDLAIAQAPNINAEYACVMDSEGEIYFNRNMDEETNIASVTKIMTGLITLEECELTEVVTVSDAAADVGGSSASLRSGDSMDVETALKALLIPSGNDAAYALAEYIGAKVLRDNPERLAQEGQTEITDPIDAFVFLMNAKAAELGMENTLYANPHGLDDGEWDDDMYCTAHDVALLCKEAMTNETFRTIVRMGDTSITVQRGSGSTSIDLEATDRLLTQYDKAIGIKTGYTDLAGYCFAGAVSYDGLEMYCIALNSTDEQSRFTDVQNMSEWVYAHRIRYMLSNSSETTSMQQNGETVEVPVVAEVAHDGWVDTTFKVTLSDPAAEVDVFDFEGNVYQTFSLDTITSNVKAGDVVGHVTFHQRDTELVTLDLIACEDQPAPNIFQSIGIFFERMSREANNEPTRAVTIIHNTLPYIVNKTVAA